MHAHATDEAVLAAAQDDSDWTGTDAQPFEASRGYAAAIGHTTHEDTPVLVGQRGAEDGGAHRCGVVTGLGVTTAWLIGRLTPGSARRTSTMALCGVVGAQLTQTIKGRQCSPLVVATAVGSALVLAGIVQTPVVSHFFGCTPLGPVAWTGVGAAIGTAALAPWLLPPAERLLSQLADKLRPVVQISH